MSLMNAIANVRKPIGSGCSRVAYYSKKYDVVIKKSGYRSDELCSQSREEARIFSEMTEEEKQFFPMIAVIKNCIIMKRCVPLDTLPTYEWHGHDLANKVRNITKSLSLDKDKENSFVDFCYKYNIGDMHLGNVGLLDNHLVVIDAGW